MPCPASTLLVRTGQPLARLNFYLLEPRSDDGLVNWNFLDSPAGGIDALFNRAPIRKVMRPLAAAATVIREV